jgi:hypothetical protein
MKESRADSGLHQTETPDVSYIKNVDVTHEESDVSVKPIAWFVFWLFVFAVVVHVAMWGLFKFFEHQAREYDRQNPPAPMARKDDERLPPEPRLQLAPGFKAEGTDLSFKDTKNPELKIPQGEMIVVREKWARELNSYGWVDEQNGVVRLPIERAKKLLLEKGLPARQQAQSSNQQTQGQTQGQTGEGERVPSASSSGQQTEKKNQ